MEFGALVALGTECDRRRGTLNKQDKLIDPQERETLEILQTEVYFIQSWFLSAKALIKKDRILALGQVVQPVVGHGTHLD